MRIVYTTSLILILTSFFGVDTYSQAKIVVNIKQQNLYLIHRGDTLNVYRVSTSINGIGAHKGSRKTPLGKHKIDYKIGDGMPIGTIFVSRESTGKIAEIYKDKTDEDEDLVLTRILQLRGLEPGVNLGGNVDSYERRIYIHGTNEEGLIGVPASHGCIRMLNDDVIDLYDRVAVSTIVEIVEN
ncbi:MAG: L,D-transpeptidase [Bacteroidota bacterium]